MLYWNKLEIDSKAYPVRSPGYGAANWQVRDWETGLVYCSCCGWYAGEDDASKLS